MEFISAEEFLKQPKEVQNVFLEWWTPNAGDLYTIRKVNKDMYPIKCVKRSEDDLIIALSAYIWEEKSECIPLLSEGQIRRFIEDKTNCKLNVGNISRVINIYKKELDIPYEVDLLQVYWKVATEIAKGE